MEFAVCQPKMVWLPWKKKKKKTKKKTCQLNSRPQMWPLGLTLATALCTKGMWVKNHVHDADLLVTKVRCKDLPGSHQGDFRCQHAINSSSSGWTEGIFTTTLTLNFQGQIFNLLYCIFKVKFWNSCISGMGELINIEQKGCESVNHDHDWTFGDQGEV